LRCQGWRRGIRSESGYRWISVFSRPHRSSLRCTVLSAHQSVHSLIGIISNNPHYFLIHYPRILLQPHTSTSVPTTTTHNQMEVIMSNGSSDSTAASISMSNGLTRPLNASEIESLAQLDRLKLFLATAPSRWTSQAQAQAHSSTLSPLPTVHPALNRFLLPSGEYVSCVLWSGLYHITGTDIVRALVFRFEAFGRPVVNMKKFEEGVFSDLRNLKPGTDACLEEPKVSYLIFSCVLLLAAAIWPARFFSSTHATALYSLLHLRNPRGLPIFHTPLRYPR
jgi:hypothetical protein